MNNNIIIITTMVHAHGMIIVDLWARRVRSADGYGFIPASFRLVTARVDRDYTVKDGVHRDQ